MNEIKCSGTITYEEVLDAQDAIWKTPKKSYIVILIIVGLCAFLLLVLTLFVRFLPSLVADLNGGQPVEPPPLPISILIAIIIFTVLYPTTLFWAKRRGRKAFQEDKFLRSSLRYTLSQEAFAAEGDYGKTRIPWTDFIRWQETSKLFLFYETKWRAHIFPKRFLQQVEQEQLKAWLSEVNITGQKQPQQIFPDDKHPG
ncbi:MAG: YcxB family protein [Planctomycetota bacterium]|jgi:hypothetical protein